MKLDANEELWCVIQRKQYCWVIGVLFYNILQAKF